MIPLKRNLKLGMRGNDVYAVKRMLKYKGFGDGMTMRGPGRFFFGTAVRRNVKRFQKRYGVAVDGVYGAGTHRKAVASRGFDAYGAWLMGSVLVKTAADRIIVAALFGVRVRSQIHYTQSWLRMYGVRNKIRIPKIPIWEDCSSFVTWCFWHAGVKDPNGLGYNGYGYTGTLARNGRLVASPQRGDLIFYGGGWPYGHVALYIGDNKVVSHGSESGPQILRWNYRPVRAIRRYV